MGPSTSFFANEQQAKHVGKEDVGAAVAVVSVKAIFLDGVVFLLFLFLRVETDIQQWWKGSTSVGGSTTTTKKKGEKRLKRKKERE